jgi:FkbM family methyltransferase
LVTIPQQYNHLTQTRYGTLIYNRFDTFVGRSIELYGEFAEREIGVLDQTVSAGMVVLDIGAQIGAQTLFLARKVGPAGRVLAFEPRRLIFQTLCGNMAINSVSNVHCWNAAVGAQAGESTACSWRVAISCGSPCQAWKKAFCEEGRRRSASSSRCCTSRAISSWARRNRL